MAKNITPEQNAAAQGITDKPQIRKKPSAAARFLSGANGHVSEFAADDGDYDLIWWFTNYKINQDALII